MKPERRPRPVRRREDGSSSRSSRAAGFEFESKIVGGIHPPGVRPGGRGRREGRLHPAARWPGYPVVDVKASLVDGSATTTSTRPRWPSAIAGVPRGARGGIEGRPARRCSSPIMDLEIIVLRTTSSARSTQDLSSRRGRISRASEIARRLAGGRTPSCRSAEMFGYATDLRSSTQGRASVHDAVLSLRTRTEGDLRQDPRQAGGLSPCVGERP